MTCLLFSGQPETIQVIGDAEQESLSGLRSDRSAWSTAGEFSFGDGEDGFNQGSSDVSMAGKVLSHLSADSSCAAAGEAFGGDNAVCLQLLTAGGVISFGIELGVCQHAAYGRMLMRLGDQGWQSFHGPCRALWARMSWLSTSTISASVSRA